MSKEQKQKMPRGFSLIKAIRQEKDYKSNIQRRDKNVRKFLEAEYDILSDRYIQPGALIMFRYDQPKTEEELEYYDAMPCTIFFNVIKTKQGETRVLGFNAHYYPPRVRFQVMDRVMEIFKEIYKKSWSEPTKREIGHFDYDLLVYLLQKAHLEFGVRMYIPELMKEIRPIPPAAWSKAVLTEGHFRKQTRDAILNYWRQWKPDASDKRNRKKGAKQAKKILKNK